MIVVDANVITYMILKGDFSKDSSKCPIYCQRTKILTRIRFFFLSRRFGKHKAQSLSKGG